MKKISIYFLMSLWMLITLNSCGTYNFHLGRALYKPDKIQPQVKLDKVKKVFQLNNPPDIENNKHLEVASNSEQITAQNFTTSLPKINSNKKAIVIPIDKPIKAASTNQIITSPLKKQVSSTVQEDKKGSPQSVGLALAIAGLVVLLFVSILLGLVLLIVGLILAVM